MVKSSMLIEPGCKLIYMSTIGARILEARTAAGFESTAAFAKELNRVLKQWGYEGISRSAVAQWESDSVSHLRPENLLAVSDVTGYELRWIAINIGPKKLDAAAQHPGSDSTEPKGMGAFSREEQTVIEVYRKLQSPERARLREIVDWLVSAKIKIDKTGTE
jgi:transcriptional regulator with XRE-family HTH domain